MSGVPQELSNRAFSKSSHWRNSRCFGFCQEGERRQNGTQLSQIQFENPIWKTLKISLQYSCFVEDCDKKCSTPQKRRMHLVDKHMFPKDYDFFIVKDGIDNRSSMLRSGRHRRKSSAAQNSISTDGKLQGSTRGPRAGTERQDIDREPSVSETPEENRPLTPPSSREDEDMAGLAGAMSSLKFVPPSVRFGRGRGKGFSRTWDEFMSLWVHDTRVRMKFVTILLQLSHLDQVKIKFSATNDQAEI